MSPPRNPVIIIPARLASTRLPGKPLADIHGTPMIVHVWRRAVAADVGPVMVACADREIADVISAAGGDAVMTRPDHATGSDRVFEALRSRDPGGAFDAVINLQGDLPTIAPALLAAVLEALGDGAVDIATLASVITDARERDDPNVVKAVAAIAPGHVSGRALYFSRAPVPAGDGALLHHIGIYAYRAAALARFVGLPEGVLERREKLEQLRALEAGMHIAVALVDRVPDGVDTPADLERARARLATHSSG
jgi:3-deoxy-manno-octulosonate cytidylyltransferase (CMP-KDO synthetase)